MFNNKGITNYIDEAPLVDRAYDAEVVVKGANGMKVKLVREIRTNETLAVSDEGFVAHVPAGGWAAYAVTTDDL